MATTLYICYICPFAQRAWIARNYKPAFVTILFTVKATIIIISFPSNDQEQLFKLQGQEDNIKLVPIDLQNRPDWYKDKVYPQNKVPLLEHNGKVLGESHDLITYVDANSEGPALFPHDAAKKEFGEQLFSYSDMFIKDAYSSLKAEDLVLVFDYLENALGKFDDGPFSLVNLVGHKSE